jgi:GntR family transcriptional regulator, histidine utilization repressor
LTSKTNNAMPLYERVKEHVLQQVASGALAVDSRVPSENELVRELGVSRMTVNRAIKDLTSEGVLFRTPGVGTFVARQSPRTHPLEIHNIADEIRSRGHEYSAAVLSSDRVLADQRQAIDFVLAPRARLFHSLVLHRENDVPVQLEDRLVNPAVAPHYLEEDFLEHTPHEYLMKVAPLQRAEHILKAVMPTKEVARKLEMPVMEPCLLLLRRTWTSDVVASCATLYYPASRYEFAGRFTPVT